MPPENKTEDQKHEAVPYLLINKSSSTITLRVEKKNFKLKT